MDDGFKFDPTFSRIITKASTIHPESKQIVLSPITTEEKIMTEQEWLRSKDPTEMLRVFNFSKDSVQGRLHPPSDRKLRLFACACARATDLFARDDGSARLAVKTAERFADGERAKTLIATFGGRPESTTSLFKYALLGSHCCEKSAVRAAELMALCKDGPPVQTKAALLRDIIGNPWCPVTLPVYRRCATCKRRPPDQWWEICPHCQPKLCGFENHCDWLTPTVLSLAQAAYDERPGKKCEECDGFGYHRDDWFPGDEGRMTCRTCHGTGRVEDGTLDPFRLALLADALEEAGIGSVKCPKNYGEGDGTAVPLWFVRGRHYACDLCKGMGMVPHPILEHLRSPSPHYRGMWSLDLVLGKS